MRETGDTTTAGPPLRRLSVIVPAYNEAPNLEPLWERLSAAARLLGDLRIEFVIVDDASTDETPAVLAELRRKDPRVRTLRLARNSGSHAAIRAGFDRCGGEAACALAADLQHPPEMLVEMVAAWLAGHDVVWASRRSRPQRALDRMLSHLYYRGLRSAGLGESWEGGADAVLIGPGPLAAVRRMRERNTSLFALVLWAGFRQTAIPYDGEPRLTGESKWSWAKKAKLAEDSLVSFSLAPIRAIGLAGIALLGLGVAALVAWGAAWAAGTYPSSAAGLAALMVALTGALMGALGVVAHYLWRAFDEARGRPLYLVEEEHGFEARPAESSEP